MINWEETCRLIPDGVQTLSKMPSKHVNGIYPKRIVMGKDAYIYDEAGKKYVDYPLGLGAILLGHANERVNKKLVERMAKGVLFGLPNPDEAELAQMIKDFIPSAEMMRFLKTGSEACAAAVKIARAVTGKDVVVCCGYHGWLDWFTASTPKNKGIPEFNKHLIRKFEYNNIESLEKQIDKNVACVMLEPYIYDEPKNNFLVKVRQVCDKNKIPLIFDEVVTGFRTMQGSAQKYYKVTPDITCLGKALGNGLPIGVVAGKKEIMEVLRGDCFVSSTFGGELLSIASAIETLNVLRDTNGIAQIWSAGEAVKSGFNSIAASMGLSDKCRCIGHPCRTFFEFPSPELKGLFWQECLEKGVFFGFAQFASLAHQITETDLTVDAMRHALYMCRKYWDDPKKLLKGDAPEETLRLQATR